MTIKDKMVKLTGTADKILRNEFPRKIGKVDTLQTCIERMRLLAAKAYINKEPDELINQIVDASDYYEQLSN